MVGATVYISTMRGSIIAVFQVQLQRYHDKVKNIYRISAEFESDLRYEVRLACFTVNAPHCIISKH